MSVVSGPSLNEEGRALVERLGGRWMQDRGMCRCPSHDDRNPSLSVRIGRSRLLFHCFAGCETADILRELRRAKLSGWTATAAGGADDAGARDDRLADAALRLWGSARSIAGTPAERYLAGRALTSDSLELRFHPRTPHGPRPFTRYRPALIAVVRDETGLVGVHRTFLDPRRPSVARLAEPKSALGRLGRGAVRLGGLAPKIGLAEGIETALSATALFGVPCWATLGTERFRHLAFPLEITELLLFLDNDAGGRRAEALAREAFDLPVTARYPPRPGEDWNDVLRAQARAGGAP